MIDLRSDTVTKPTAAMRQAMFDAEVGDDVYAEDPTVRKLEERAAEIFGKQAGLFVPTGTMGNTIGIKINTQHGQEVICDHRAHVLDWELSMCAWFAGCLVRPVPTSDGVMTWAALEPYIRNFGPHNAPTALITVENSHNMGGGTVYPQPVLDEICEKAHARGLKVHMDGARVFNSSVASNTPVNRITRDVDSVMFCVSKGLGAPAGSLIVGRSDDMAAARLYRKRLGGGMRQSGILAAAGLIAVNEMTVRLADDHANAKLLAEGLSGMRGIEIDPAKVQTNIVIFDIAKTGMAVADYVAAMKSRGVLLSGVGGTRVRMVTHFDVSRQDCVNALEAARLVV